MSNEVRYVVQLKGKLSEFWLQNFTQLVADLAKIDEDADFMWLMGKFTADAKKNFIKTIFSMDGVSIVSFQVYDQ